MTTSRIMLALAATLVAAPASADEKLRVAPSSPISVAELRELGAGTVAGTVSEVGPRGFMLDDGGSIWVRTKEGRSHLRVGDGATVTGNFDRGTLRAHRVIAGDGAVVAARDDDDDDHDRARAALQAGDIRPLSEILDAAAREFPGQVLEVELEHEHGAWIYEMKVLAKDGAVLKLEYDARTATLLRARGPGVQERRR